MDNDDPFLGCSDDRYYSDVSGLVSCNCISDSIGRDHRFSRLYLSGERDQRKVAGWGGRSTLYPGKNVSMLDEGRRVLRRLESQDQ